jgi:hypothetical protein
MNDRSYSGLVIGSAPNDWHITSTGDFNGDGKSDIPWRSDGGSVATWGHGRSQLWRGCHRLGTE